ncbi:MAG: transporter substrate-binding domain-containing protein [Alphaproteobacteria bacterium]|nr:transporter substrate-binding domain-containing protein [Alphaproteobacteria bacterium]
MKTALSILAAVVIALGVQNTLFSDNTSRTVSQQPAYDRVLKTNTLRCAYAVFPHFLEKDPNTGKLSGIMPSLMEEVGKLTGLTVEWGPEIDYGDIALTLQTGKADLFCTGIAMTPSRGRVIGGSTPVAYAPMAAYVRANDQRFDNAPDKINNPSIKIEVNEGDFSEEIAKRFFPKATLVYRGPTGGESQLFLDVAMNKADVTFSGPSYLSIFNTNNPDIALRLAPFNQTIYAVPVVLAGEIREEALLRMIDVALKDIINNNVMDKLLHDALGQDYAVAYFPPKKDI